MVIMCGELQIPMLQQGLSSIYKSFKCLPHIYIITDRSLKPQDCRLRIRWFPQKHISIISSADCIEYHKIAGNDLIAKFAERSPMGLKLAGILQVSNLNKPLLYSDTDVLWKNDPHVTLENILNYNSSTIHMSHDFQSSYDFQLIKNKRLDVLLHTPYYCAGIMFITKIPDENLRLINNLISECIDNSNHFTEQTIFSYIQKLAGDSMLLATDFTLSLDDQFSLLPKTTNSIARHYVGPVRHLFWRDSFLALFSKY